MRGPSDRLGRLLRLILLPVCLLLVVWLWRVNHRIFPASVLRSGQEGQ